MKIWSVFSLVIIFHLVVIGLLLVQPGCQNRPPAPPVEPTLREPAQPAEYVEPQQSLDPAFNAGVGAPTGSASRSLSEPTRPSGGQRTAPDTGLLEPVLEPVRDELSLPPVSREYTVKQGDTLSGIAKREGVSLTDLLAANGLTRNSTIYVGQVLLIPASAPRVEDAAAEVEHSGKEVIVSRGDTLSLIAARNGTTVQAIKTLNGLTRDTIFVGQRLAIPESGSTGGTSPTRATTLSPSFAGGQTYTVQPGDTPSGIARRFGISSAQLMSANNITDARKLYVGRQLVIPETGSSGTGSATPAQSRTASPTRSGSTMTTRPPAEPLPEPLEEDPMSVLEALEDEDLPFVEVEVVEEEEQPEN